MPRLFISDSFIPLNSEGTHIPPCCAYTETENKAIKSNLVNFIDINFRCLFNFGKDTIFQLYEKISLRLITHQTSVMVFPAQFFIQRLSWFVMRFNFEKHSF